MQQAEAISRLVDAVEVQEFTTGQLIVVKVTPLSKSTLTPLNKSTIEAKEFTTGQLIVVKVTPLPERHSLFRYSYIIRVP
jgi:hypothetical protein